MFPFDRKEIPPGTENKKKGTILIVDDDPQSLTILGSLLKDDFEVLVASSGEVALRIVEKVVPDLILLDVVMPGIDGYEVCRRIGRMPEHHHTPIIFITSLANAEDELKGLQTGAVDFIHKPFAKESVRMRVGLHFELKHNRDLLAKTLLKNRLILEAVAEGICGIDEHGLTTFANPAARRMTGYDEHEFIGRDQHQLIHHSRTDRTPNPAAECPILMTIHDSQVRQQVGEVFWRKDGSCFPVEYTVSPTPKVGGAVVVFRDISLRQKMELESMRAQKLESIGVLAGGIAHDFNNLLTGIIGFIDIGMMECGGDTSAAASLRIAKTNCIQAAELARSLITFSEGGFPIRTEVDLGRIVALLISNQPQRYRFRVDLAGDLWPLMADEVQLSSVIHHLLANAKESMPDGGEIAIMARNCPDGVQEHDGLAHGRYLRFSIIDHGCGIPAEILPKIFDPYFSTKGRGSQKGMGLGLSICLSTIKKHKGHIFLDSNPDGGATATFYLPVER
jgi:two-component system cell cycle sensor histidine kinase/response regulator CckA